MEKHRAFLAGVDAWFTGVRNRHAGRMQCGRGCALCCYRLFDLSLPDALLVSEAVAALPEQTRAEVEARARAIQARILRPPPG